MKNSRILGRALRPLLFVSALLASLVLHAETKLDISVPWGVNEFHSINATRFAERVKQETNGEVIMTVHAGGTLGVKANESLRAVAEGVVPMGEYAFFQNASRGAVLAVESFPFLVNDYDQLKILHKSFRPLWEDLLSKNNQKALYVVPWASQFFFAKKPIATIGDLKGVKMRSLDKLTTDWINRLGMSPVQVTPVDILQALGAGMLDGVPTSASTAVSQKYWDFMKYGYQTNHLWASNVMAINLDAWKKLTPAQQKTIETVAKEMEPGFWDASKLDHEKKVAELKANGMNIIAPAPKALRDEMVRLTFPLWDTYSKPMGMEAQKALAEYRKATNK